MASRLHNSISLGRTSFIFSPNWASNSFSTTFHSAFSWKNGLWCSPVSKHFSSGLVINEMIDRPLRCTKASNVVVFPDFCVRPEINKWAGLILTSPPVPHSNPTNMSFECLLSSLSIGGLTFCSSILFEGLSIHWCISSVYILILCRSFSVISHLLCITAFLISDNSSNLVFNLVKSLGKYGWKISLFCFHSTREYRSIKSI